VISNALADTTVLAGLEAVSYPTIGHFLEDGFLDPAIQSLLGGVKVAGPAVTVRIIGNDAIAMNRALLELYPGAVLVVDMDGDRRHAPVGAVTAAAAKARGAAGIVVDGVATDLLELRRTGLPVFARGTSCLTT
jgi:4-hydroxy-4-methyl-2-oxoglutarate aldolase